MKFLIISHSTLILLHRISAILHVTVTISQGFVTISHVIWPWISFTISYNVWQCFARYINHLNNILAMSQKLHMKRIRRPLKITIFHTPHEFLYCALQIYFLYQILSRPMVCANFDLFYVADLRETCFYVYTTKYSKHPSRKYVISNRVVYTLYICKEEKKKNIQRKRGPGKDPHPCLKKWTGWT